MVGEVLPLSKKLEKGPLPRPDNSGLPTSVQRASGLVNSVFRRQRNDVNEIPGDIFLSKTGNEGTCVRSELTIQTADVTKRGFVFDERPSVGAVRHALQAASFHSSSRTFPEMANFQPNSVKIDVDIPSPSNPTVENEHKRCHCTGTNNTNNTSHAHYWRWNTDEKINVGLSCGIAARHLIHSEQGKRSVTASDGVCTKQKNRVVRAVSGRAGTIVVKFFRELDMEAFLDKRRQKRNVSSRDLGYMEGESTPVYVNESLTKAKRLLLKAFFTHITLSCG
ncbi:hypothetical protein J6590_036043 [Homalodisca vitripennis]|nr:hypothetical protein J6590_036043 [Homalodisca vitripennis]